VSDSVRIFPLKSPIEQVKFGDNAKQYYGVELVGTSKFLDPELNDFVNYTIYKFNSEEEAEKAIAAYFGNGLWGAL
jgi:hypothetical protein